MNRLKIILGYILGLLVSVILLIIVFIIIIKTTIYNKEYLKKELINNNYYEMVSQDIISNMQNYSVSSGLPETVLENIFTKEEVIIDIDNYIDNLYDGVIYKKDTSEIKEKLNANIDEYLTKHELKVTTVDSLNMYKDDIGKVYAEEVELYNLLNNFIPKFQKINSILDKLTDLSFNKLGFIINSNNIIKNTSNTFYISTN